MRDGNRESNVEFDRYRDTYKDAVNASLAVTGLKVDYFAEVKAAYLKEIVAQYFGTATGLTALDFGCGVGLMHGLIGDFIGSITGVDVSEACLERARQDHKDIDYRHYDGRVLPAQDDSYDVAFAINVMHHVPPGDWQRSVGEMFRVLKPGGVAVIFEHNPWNPVTRYIVDRCEFDADAVLLSGPRTISLMEKAAFEQPRCRYILHCPAKSSFGRGVDRFFSRSPLGAQYYVVGRKP